jgi:hypothetical protein
MERRQGITGQRWRLRARKYLTTALLLFAGLACASATAAAPAADAQSPAPSKPLSPGQSLRARAYLLRLFGPSSKNQAAPHFDAKEQQVAASLIAGLDDTHSWLLRKSLSQSRQYVVVHGQSGFTGWVNPFTGVWVVGVWQRKGADWTLTALTPALAEELKQPMAASEKPGLNAAWLNPSTKPVEGLVEQERTAAAWFKDSAKGGSLAAVVQDQKRAARARAVLVARQAALHLSLVQARDRQGYQGYQEALTKLLSGTTDAAGSGSALEHQLAVIPEKVRQSMLPVMALDQKTGLTFVVQSPKAPGLVLFVHFAPDSAGQPQPARARLALLFSQRSLG